MSKKLDERMILAVAGLVLAASTVLADDLTTAVGGGVGAAAGAAIGSSVGGKTGAIVGGAAGGAVGGAVTTEGKGKTGAAVGGAIGGGAGAAVGSAVGGSTGAVVGAGVGGAGGAVIGKNVGSSSTTPVAGMPDSKVVYRGQRVESHYYIDDGDHRDCTKKHKWKEEHPGKGQGLYKHCKD